MLGAKYHGDDGRNGDKTNKSFFPIKDNGLIVISPGRPCQGQSPYGAAHWAGLDMSGLSWLPEKSTPNGEEPFYTYRVMLQPVA